MFVENEIMLSSKTKLRKKSKFFIVIETLLVAVLCLTDEILNITPLNTNNYIKYGMIYVMRESCQR